MFEMSTVAGRYIDLLRDVAMHKESQWGS
jgi:hypothetical protein